jgi:hypothetical protein
MDVAEVQAWVFARALEELGRDLDAYSDDELAEVLADAWLEWQALTDRQLPTPVGDENA